MSKPIIRAYAPDDEAALLRVWAASMTHDRLTPAAFRAQVLLDANFDPGGLRVATTADDPEQITGFVLGLRRQVPFYTDGLQAEQGWITAFGVQPECQRQGVGRALFESTLAWFAGQGAREVWIAPYVPGYFIPGVDVNAYPAAEPFLHAQGFETVMRPLSMRAELTDFQIPAAITAQKARLAEEDTIHIMPCEPRHLVPLLTFIKTHFGWDWWRMAADNLRDLFAGQADEVALWIAVQQTTAGEQIVGYAQQRRERFGPFGVMESRRGNGIGRVLLFHCLDEMRVKGFHAAWFLWTSDRAAKGVYALAGFHEVRRFAVLKKEL